MLDDPATIAAVDAARAEYATRRRRITRVLDELGTSYTGTDGINLWMQVADERSALLTLAAQGIGAAPGEPFLVRPDVDSLRITVGLVDRDHEQFAARLAAAAGTGTGTPTPR